MTPIILDFFSNPQTHEFLITQEPFLCYTILTISSQHHNHRRSAQSTPSYAIHEKAWQITKRLCEQILWAEEEGSASRLRTLGTVQALLLLTEFPPRMVHLPPVDIDTITLPDEMAATDQRRDLGFATLEDDERHIQMAKGTFLTLFISVLVAQLYEQLLIIIRYTSEQMANRACTTNPTIRSYFRVMKEKCIKRSVKRLISIGFCLALRLG